MEYFLKVMHYFRRAGLLLPRDNLFDVVKLVECFEGREVIDVETQDFVAYLTEHGVIELKEGELHALTAGGYLGCGLTSCTDRGILGLQLLQDDVGTLDDTARHTGYLSHVNTEGVLTPTRSSLRRKTTLPSTSLTLTL